MSGKTISNLSVGLFGDVSHFANAFGKNATNSVNKWAESMKEAGTVALEMTGIAALVGGVIETALDIGKGFKLAAQFDRTAISMGAMIGNAEQARDVLKELREFSVKTPFEFPEIASSARQLAAFGVTTDQIVPTLRMLGDVAAGSDTSMGELVQLYIRVREEGKLSSRVIREFTTAGIPLTDALAHSMSKTPPQIRAMLEAGQITFPQLQKALIGMTSEGGSFNNMLNKQADTMGGRWLKLSHTMDDQLEKIAHAFDQASDSGSAIDTLTDKLEKAGDAMKNLVFFGGIVFKDIKEGYFGPGDANKPLTPTVKPKIEDKDKTLPLEFTPHVHGHELVKWGSAEMLRIQQDWAGQFPKLAHAAVNKEHAAARPPGLYDFLRTFAPGGANNPTGSKLDARIKSLGESTTSDPKDSDSYVDSHGHRQHYSPEHPNPFQHVLAPDNVRQNVSAQPPNSGGKKSQDGFTPKQAQDVTFYLQQMYQTTQPSNNQVATF